MNISIVTIRWPFRCIVYEMTLSFHLSHVCMEINIGNMRLYLDIVREQP